MPFADLERMIQIVMDRETIHSGHFMASNVHDLKVDDDEEIDVVSENGVEPPDPDVTPDTKDDKPVTFYKFGPQTTRSIAIDVSLTKLNKCIQIAYEKGKLTTPKWKSFKGLKLQWKDRIRLNNVIWRAWHVQFVQNNKPKYCFFSVPEEDFRGRSEASILEGMYWKRRLETVCAQYTRWRHFYFKQGQRRRYSCTRENRRSSESDTRVNLFDDEILFPTCGTPLTFDNDDDFTSWFTDTLFSSLNQPYMFPNPRQFAQSDNADLMQPGLIQLQPSLEEIMASLESNSGFLTCDNDPTLGVGDNLDSLSSPDLNPRSMSAMMNSAPPARTATASSSSSNNHYTSKDYADASLLVSYSQQAAGSGTRTPVPLSAPRTPSSASVLPTSDYGSESGYPLSGYPSVGSNQLPYACEPYVPQVATIGAIKSEQIQYTVANSWPPPISMGQTPSLARFQVISPERNVAHQHKKHNKNRKTSSDVQQQVALSSQSCSKSNVRTSNAPITEGLLSSGPPPFVTVSKHRTKMEKPTNSCNQPTNSKLFSLPKKEHKQRKRSSQQAQFLEERKKFSQPAQFSSNPVEITPKNVPITVACNNFSSEPLQVRSSIGLQNSNVLRPIPIAFARADQSAFSPLSPNALSSLGASGLSSPIQPAPASVNSSNDFLKTLGNVTPTTNAVIHIPVSGTTFVSSVPVSAQNTPVLILQSITTGMQFPFMTLPYSSSASFSSTLPKQDSIEKSSTSVIVQSASNAPTNNSQVVVVKQETHAVHDSEKSHKMKSTKRPADSTVDPVERKRMQHLFAEQSRRSALKSGFELLEELLPDFQSTNAKATNALVLLKSAERIRELKTLTTDNTQSLNQLKSETQQLNDKIKAFQNRLPVPSPVSKSNFLQQRFVAYVKQRCEEDSKFWMLYKIMEPLFDSFKSDVQGANAKELFASAQEWITKHCNHAQLRPVISQFLVTLATESPILRDPSSFKNYAKSESTKL